jgi:hypothetical protein
MRAVLNLTGLIALATWIVLLSGCQRTGATTAPPTPEPPTAAPGSARPRGYVSRVAMGDRWPFTSDDGVVGCADRNCVTFTTGGVTYAVSDAAREPHKLSQHDWLDLRTSFIWAPEPTGIRGTRKDLRPIIDLGLTLCR